MTNKKVWQVTIKGEQWSRHGTSSVEITYTGLATAPDVAGRAAMKIAKKTNITLQQISKIELIDSLDFTT